MLSPLHASHFILTVILHIGCCFHVRVTGEAEAQRAELPKDTELESDSGQEHMSSTRGHMFFILILDPSHEEHDWLLQMKLMQYIVIFCYWWRVGNTSKTSM